MIFGETNMRIKFFLIFLIGCFFSSYNLEANNTLIAGLNDDSSTGKMSTSSFSVKAPSKEARVDYEIHFNEKQKAFAQRLRVVLEYVTVPLIEYFNFTPQDKVHFIIKGDADSANGSATPFPRNLIELYDYPPLGKGQLSANPNWLEALVLHELIHAFHLDRTTGFLQGLRSIFGSVGKLGGLTPRWFTEGLATWGESYFTGRGRRLSLSIYDEVLEVISRKDFCASADCLDFPSDYPGGALSYFIGSHFLHSLEEQKPGSLRCLVEANSDSVIFFLNSAFKECVGVEADEAFRIYLNKEKENLTNWQKKVEGGLGETTKINLEKEAPFHFSKSVATFGGKLFLLKTKRSVEEMLQVNEKGEVEKRFSFPEIVGQLSEQTLIEGEVSSKLALTLGPSRKTWLIFDLASGQIVKTLRFDKDVHYLLPYEDKFIKIIYRNNTWNILEDEKILWTSPPFLHLVDPSLEVNKGQLYLNFKSHEYVDGKQRFALARFHFSTNKTEWLLESPQNFEMIGSCSSYDILRRGDRVIARNKDSAELFELSGLFKHALFFKHSLGVNFTRQFSRVRELYLVKGQCRELIEKSRVNDQSSSSNLEVERFVSGSIVNISEDSYPALKHFAPKYWLLNYSGSEEDSMLSTNTSLNDPKSFHQFGLGVNWYTELEKIAPNVSYTWAPGSFQGSLIYSDAFNKSEVDNNIDEYKFRGTILSYTFEGDYWSYKPAIAASDVRTQDFISRREYQREGIVNILSKSRLLANSFWQSFDLYSNHFMQQTENRRDFFGQEYLASSRHAINLDWHFNLRASYGKYDKKDLGSGVLFGGTSSLGKEAGESIHSFYGIDYRQAFGNEIFTSRFQFDLNILRIYRGPRIFPTYLREIHLLFGADYIKTEFLIYQNRILRAKEAHSFHGGLKLTTVLLYVAPLDFDFIYAKAYLPANRENDAFLLLGSTLF
jgi:hypothetical protein